MAPTKNQRICIEETFGIPTAVAAGAGSGKTDTLTKRVAYALLHPEVSGVSDIDQILAITFTNKAAAELKSRIKQVLDEQATPENGLRDQALKTDGAWISTIHGMCSRILRENALAFGIDPAFELASNEVLEKLIKDAVNEVMDQVLETGLSSEEGQLLREYDKFDLERYLRFIVTSIADNPAEDPIACFVIPPAGDPVEYLLQLFICTQEALQFLEDKQSGPRGKALGSLEQGYYDRACEALAKTLGVESADASIDRLLAAIMPNERIEQLHGMGANELLMLADLFPKVDGRSKKFAAIELEATGLKPNASFTEAILNMRIALGSRYLPVLLRIAQCVHVLFEQKKSDRGLLDNNDLLKLVARNLKDPDHAAIAERYADQFQLVMVDEFQDTNQMQVEMINLVAGGDSDVLNPKMCVVGDAQQSIYRFRNADLTVFQNHVRQVDEDADGAVIKLEDNFRSHADILAFCKGVFGDVFGDDYLDLLHGRNEEYAAAKGPYFGAESGEDISMPRRVNVKAFKPEGSAGITRMAARAIARDFKELCDRGNSPGEMAILLGTMTNAAVYAQALKDVGLKCAITGGSVFRKDADVELIMDLCAVLTNPYDTEKLATVLTSDLFCLSADDLVKLVNIRKKRKGPLSDVFTLTAYSDKGLLPNDASDALRHAVSVLQRALSLVGRRPLSSIAEDVLIGSGWLYGQNEEGLSRAANAFKALRILRDIEREFPSKGFGLVDQFRARIAVTDEAPGVLSAKGDDFVRIMTIHASKGLSIPIVAVAEADFDKRDLGTFGSITRDGFTYLILDVKKSVEQLPENGLVRNVSDLFFKACDPITTERDAVQALERVQRVQANTQANAKGLVDYYAAIRFLNYQGELEEHQRKLYVAFTRAKDALITTHKLSKSYDLTANGRPTVPEAIDVMMDERTQAEGLVDEEPDEFNPEATQILSQVFSLHTEYPQAPDHDLDWQLRYQLYQMKKPPAEGAAADDENVVETAEIEQTTPSDEPVFVRTSITVPVPHTSTHDLKLMPYKVQWSEGIVSASSLKDASGEHAATIDPEPLDPQETEARALVNALDGTDDFDFDNLDTTPDASAADRGVAFHALCEWAVTHKAPGKGGALQQPPNERIQAMARLYGLNARQEQGLQSALDRWLSSEEATRAVQHKHLKAEEPFWVQLLPAQEGSEPLVLQGFLDLLCYDEAGSGTAFVVDYKTGTRYNTPAKRRGAYELQAMCYAYALLMQGFDEVQLSFVFVDQSRSDDESAPIVERFPEQGSVPWTVEYLRERILDML